MRFIGADSVSDLLSVRYKQSVQVFHLDLLELQDDRETKKAYEAVSSKVTTASES
jgi:hypothetical protein